MIFGLAVYHLFNVWTDVRYRKTKNMWHLLFLLIGMGAYYFQPSVIWWRPWVGAIITLLLGLIFEGMKFSSPGDTKMLIVSAIWIGTIFPSLSVYRVVLGVVLFHLSFFFVFSYISLIKKKGLKYALRSQILNLKAMVLGLPLSNEKVVERFPGAITIALGSLFYYFLISGGASL
ncbi:hypothetical protein L1765_10075 [Microaerobacter geothermalis]|uniref:hypothetical protein n=1 Tax=Microaerobacter geothermalis TaxID=674972 RepID=UPI001F2F1A64|nr:hypothetical protein [Microaerobacter geothermalis]MCF6094309.1 hypothetical protein [Microaerobacter geothermalis]